MARLVPSLISIEFPQEARVSVSQDRAFFPSSKKPVLRKGWLSGVISLCRAVFLFTVVSLTFICDARAGDLVFGIGRDNVDEANASEATTFQLEYHSSPIRSFRWGSVAAMGVLEYDEDEDFYAGLGLSVIWDATPKWFVEYSLAAGYYDWGGEKPDLGGDVQFRTLVGFGYRVSDISRISIALDHLSNAGLEDRNPGRNAVMLRYARSF